MITRLDAEFGGTYVVSYGGNRPTQAWLEVDDGHGGTVDTDIDLSAQNVKQLVETLAQECSKIDALADAVEVEQQRDQRLRALEMAQPDEPDGEGDIRPTYYDTEGPYEPRKVAEAWGLHRDAYLFDALKYIARRGNKPGGSELKDMQKARTYIGFKVSALERGI